MISGLYDLSLAIVIRQDVPDPEGFNSPSLVSMVMVGLTIAVLAGTLLYFLVLVPRRRRKPMLEAFHLLQQDDPTTFHEAESLLYQALTSGLRKADVAQTRFALAYVRARLNRFLEAAVTISELQESGLGDRDSAYLHLWLQSRLEDHDKTVDVYEEHRKELGDLLDTKLIAGMAFLEKARRHWAKREVKGAMHYFQQLRELGVMESEIPSQLDDQEVVLGIASLFDKRIPEAQERFESAQKTANLENRPSTQAELGILLCHWKKEGGAQTVDEGLVELISRLEQDRKRTSDGKEKEIVTACRHCGHEFRVPSTYDGENVSCRNCQRKFSVSERPRGEDASAPEQVLLNDHDLLLRNVRLWHTVSAVACGEHKAPLQGMPDEQLDAIRSRARAVTALDPEMGDGLLVEGLAAYYFSRSEVEHREGFELMRQAIDLGVTVPEVLDLVDRERRLEEFERDAPNRFLELVRRLLADPDVAEKWRDRLEEGMEHYPQFRKLGAPGVDQEALKMAHPLAGLHDRTKLVLDRVRRWAEKCEPDQKETFEKRVQELEELAGKTAEGADEMQGRQIDLLMELGPVILGDETPGENES